MNISCARVCPSNRSVDVLYKLQTLPNMVIMVNMTMTMLIAYVTIVLAVEPLVVGELPDNTSSTFPW